MEWPAPVAEPKPSTYAGLFLTTLSLLQLELFLTRIFSVTMWYHFAFVAISVAMFGMTVGALVVYLRPAWFPDARLAERLGAAALLFGVTIVLGLLTLVACSFATLVLSAGVAPGAAAIGQSDRPLLENLRAIFGVGPQSKLLGLAAVVRRHQGLVGGQATGSRRPVVGDETPQLPHRSHRTHARHAEIPSSNPSMPAVANPSPSLPAQVSEQQYS